MIHKKKILSKYFQAVADGTKTFGIRKEDDCRYEVEDLIELEEIEEVVLEFEYYKGSVYTFDSTGNKQLVEVTYRLSHEDFPEGIKEGYVVLGIELRSNFDKAKDKHVELMKERKK